MDTSNFKIVEKAIFFSLFKSKILGILWFLFRKSNIFLLLLLEDFVDLVYLLAFTFLLGLDCISLQFHFLVSQLYIYAIIFFS